MCPRLKSQFIAAVSIIPIKKIEEKTKFRAFALNMR